MLTTSLTSFVFGEIGCTATPRKYNPLTIGGEKVEDKKWWDYYERGLKAMEKGLYEEAIQHFDRAIQEKPKDEWNVRTHERNSIDYFPNRERGIAYLNMEDYNNAVYNLERSISQTDTSKARAYLDLARREILLISKEDKAAPVISIDPLKEPQVFTFYGPVVVVSGTVEDDCYVERISINGEAYPLDLATKTVNFIKIFPLEKAKNNTITVRARDLVGNETEQSVKLNFSLYK